MRNGAISAGGIWKAFTLFHLHAAEWKYPADRPGSPGFSVPSIQWLLAYIETRRGGITVENHECKKTAHAQRSDICRWNMEGIYTLSPARSRMEISSGSSRFTRIFRAFNSMVVN